MRRLTLIIPIYNGAPYLRETIKELQRFHAHTPLYEIILVNDGSTDTTEQEIHQLLSYGDTKPIKEQLPLTIFSYIENKGKGYAITHAVERAKETDIIGFTDIELPYGLEKISDMVACFCHHRQTDIVIGKREQSPRSYTMIRRVYKTMFRFLLPKKVKQFRDTQCGFKWFRYGVAKELFAVLHTNRWVFDIELLLAAVAQQKKIKELTVSLKPRCRTRGSVSLWTHGRQVCRDMRTILSYDKRGAYQKTTH